MNRPVVIQTFAVFDLNHLSAYMMYFRYLAERIQVHEFLKMMNDGIHTLNVKYHSETVLEILVELGFSVL